MKESFKKCCCLGLVLFLMLGGVKEVNAADGHCGTIRVTCGGLVGNATIEPHKVHTVLGKVITCQRTKELHFHTIFWTGCNTALKSNVVGTCLIKHTVCNSEVGDCQSLR